jgi:hypothetical protein
MELQGFLMNQRRREHDLECGVSRRFCFFVFPQSDSLHKKNKSGVKAPQSKKPAALSE